MAEGLGHHLLLFDGVCGLCNGIVRFVLPRDRAAAFDFASLQSATGRSWLGRVGYNPDALDTLVVITDYRTDHAGVHVRSDAALSVARALARPWRALSVFRFIPRTLRDFCYDVIARRRYRLFGRYDSCPVPAPRHRARFIDL
jgi:predicted DCC family thiol-disulfide oxidoreductase YuxK